MPLQLLQEAAGTYSCHSARARECFLPCGLADASA